MPVSASDVKQVVGKIGGLLGAVLEVDDWGCGSFRDNEGISFAFQVEPGEETKLHQVASLLRVTAPMSEALMRRALELSVLDVYDGAVGYNDAHSTLTYSRSVTLKVFDVERVALQFASWVEQSRELKKALEPFGGSAGADVQSPSEAFLIFR